MDPSLGFQPLFGITALYGQLLLNYVMSEGFKCISSSNGSAYLVVSIKIWENCTRKTNVLVFHRLYCSKNIVDFLLSQRDIAFYLRTKCCVKFYIEKNANMYYKLSDMIKQIFLSSLNYLH